MSWFKTEEEQRMEDEYWHDLGQKAGSGDRTAKVPFPDFDVRKSFKSGEGWKNGKKNRKN